MRNPEAKLKKKRPEHLRQLYFDSLLFSPEAIRHLFSCNSLSDDEKAAILRNTAAKLLKLAA